MFISRDRFSELVSLYLDDEASVEELKLLSECVNSNAQMRAIFVRACRIHVAICKLYNKPVRLRKIYGLDFALKAKPKKSAAKIACEWGAVAATGLAFIGLSAFVLINAFGTRAETLPVKVHTNPKYSYLIVEFGESKDARKNPKVFSALKISRRGGAPEAAQ